jgi:glycosyltransferase involved in cell wall biosynthesis
LTRAGEMDATESRSTPGPDLDAPSHIELSVVMPCRNEAEQLPGQLAALAGQEWPGAWEVIIADNGSTDATRAVALAFADRLPRLRVVDASAKSGRHFACNAGVRAATGRSVVFVDADDRVAPGYLAAMADALEDHEIVAARLDHAQLDASWMAGVGSTTQTTGLQDGFGFLPYGGGCSLGLQRAVFDQVGGFREDATLCEDVDLCWRVQLSGHELTYVPDAVVYYRSRPTLSAMYRQHRDYGRARANLYRAYRSVGMPARTPSEAAAEWWTILRSLPRLRTRTEVARWSRRLGRSVGQLQGSVRYRVWYP